VRLRTARLTIAVGIYSIVALFCLAFAAVFPDVVFADDSFAGRPVEVIMLVDQSGSMGGEKFGMPLSAGQQANDPDGLRFAAPLAALDILGVDRLGLHRDASYRFGVINFGGRPGRDQNASNYIETSLKLTPIGPSNLSEWERLQKVIVPTLADETWARQKRNLGSTSFLEPFRQACAEFTSSAARDPVRVLILVTDGIPEWADDPPVDVSGHLSAVQQIVRGCDAMRGASIHVIGLNDFGKGSYFDTVSELWGRVTAATGSTAGSTGLIASNQQLHQKVAKVISSVIPWGSRVQTVTSVPPLLDRVVFRIFKTSRRDEIRIFPPGETGAGYLRCQPPVECTGQADLTEIVTLLAPKAGMWRVEVVSGKDVEVWKTELPLSVSVEAPPSLIQFAANRVTVRLLSLSGRAWDPLADKGSVIDWSESLLVEDTGESTSLVFREVADGIQAEVVPSGTGCTTLRLKGSAKGFDETGAPRNVYPVEAERQLPCGVAGTRGLLWFEVSAIDDGEAGAVHGLPFWVGSLDEKPVRVRVIAATPGGAALPLSKLFERVEPIEVVVIGPAGENSVQLDVSKTGDGWEATIPMLEVGKYQLSVKTPGSVLPRVSVEPAPAAGLERYEPEGREIGERIQIGVASMVIALGAWHLVVWLAHLRAPHLLGMLEVTPYGGPRPPRPRQFSLRSPFNSRRIRVGGGQTLVIRQRTGVTAGSRAQVVVATTGRPFWVPLPISVTGDALYDGESRSFVKSGGRSGRGQQAPSGFDVVYRARR